MENKDLYKIFQLSYELISKYHFSQIMISEFSQYSSREMWLFNLDDKNYQLIRISNFVSSEYYINKNRVNTYINYFINNRHLNNLKFLDIYINQEEYDDNLEEYDYINIEENYSSGIDLHNIYPEIYNCIHFVEDGKQEIQRITSNVVKIIKENKSKNNNNKDRSKVICTYILTIVCVLLFGVKYILQQQFEPNTVAIYMGADYKTFTLGLHQYYRLITYAFVHNDVIHLLFNMISLISIGRYVEARFGHRDYLIVLFVSIIFGALSQNILTENGLCMGISAGLYGLFVVFIMDVIHNGLVKTQALLPTVFINVYLNFMSNTAWLAHIGGAIAGIIMYQYLSKTGKERYIPLGFTFLCMILLFIKYNNIESIKTLYIATDNKVLEMIKTLGFNNEANRLMSKLITLYSKIGGIK